MTQSGAKLAAHMGACGSSPSSRSSFGPGGSYLTQVLGLPALYLNIHPDWKTKRVSRHLTAGPGEAFSERDLQGAFHRPDKVPFIGQGRA